MTDPQAPSVPIVKKSNDVFPGFRGDKLLPLTDDLCATISKHNGNMTLAEVRDALEQGLPVHTNLSRYELVKP